MDTNVLTSSGGVCTSCVYMPDGKEPMVSRGGLGSRTTEPERRVNEACALIASAVRLGHTDAAQISLAVRSAISQGAEQLAKDIREEAG